MAHEDTFLNLIEQIEARDLMTRESFGSAWTRDDPNFVTNLTHGLPKRRKTRTYNAAFRECVRLIDRVRAGTLNSYWLQEAMSTSDFSLLFGDVIDRQVLGFFAEQPPVWRNFMRVGTVRDFRTVYSYSVAGGEGQLQPVKELAPYPHVTLTPSRVGRSVSKYGQQMAFSFETMINDDLSLLTDTPRRFARAARRSESKFATSMYVGASGPSGLLYTAGNKNIINIANGASANNPPLSLSGLQDGLFVLSQQKDSDGEPIVIEAVHLAVPPALEQTALTILNSREIIVGADSAATRQLIDNWMRNRVRLSVDWYIPYIATTANANTSWFLFADAQSDRPAIEFDYLRGYEQPQLFIVALCAIRVGGGAVDPMQGDFDFDALAYKVRHIFGGGVIEPKATVASNGTGA